MTTSQKFSRYAWDVDEAIEFITELQEYIKDHKQRLDVAATALAKFPTSAYGHLGILHHTQTVDEKSSKIDVFALALAHSKEHKSGDDKSLQKIFWDCKFDSLRFKALTSSFIERVEYRVKELQEADLLPHSI